jgi:predicted RNase H-like HicB family nuclease
MTKYLIVAERTATGYSAYSPDLPGCVATGSSRDEIDKNMREAIELHLEGLRAEGMEVPAPSSYSTYVEVPA